MAKFFLARCQTYLPTPVLEPLHKMAVSLESLHNMAATPETHPIMDAKPESRPVMATVFSHHGFPSCVPGHREHCTWRHSGIPKTFGTDLQFDGPTAGFSQSSWHTKGLITVCPRVCSCPGASRAHSCLWGGVYELSACPATAKEAVYELSDCPVMAAVNLSVSVLSDVP